jgi:cytochrome c-type biogenesis protein
MTDAGLVSVVLVPAGLGLIGFVEPCSIGASLIVVKHLEGREPIRKIAEMLLFTATRAAFIGALGLVAASVGSLFLGLQKGGWIVLGVLYTVIGVLYLAGRARAVMVGIGPRLSGRSGTMCALGLGVLFGLNIPACAAPLLLALLGAAAAGGAMGAALINGFIALAVFGLALSAPLVVAVLVPSTRRLLDRLAGLATRFPVFTGLVLVALGLWSIGFGLFVSVEPA